MMFKNKANQVQRSQNRTALRIEKLNERRLFAVDAFLSEPDQRQTDDATSEIVLQSSVDVTTEVPKSAVMDLNSHPTAESQVSPEQMAALEKMLIETFPELRQVENFDPTSDLWGNGVEQPQTGLEYNELVQAMQEFNEQDFQGMPTDFDAFARWLVANESNGPGVDYSGMNKEMGDIYGSGDDDFDMLDEGDGNYVISDGSRIVFEATLDSNGMVVLWSPDPHGDFTPYVMSLAQFVDFLPSMIGIKGATAENLSKPKGYSGELAEVGMKEEATAEPKEKTVEGYVDDFFAEVQKAWDLFVNDAHDAYDAVGDAIFGDDAATKPDSQPLEPELDAISKAILEMFPPISTSTQDVYSGIDEHSKYWGDKTPDPTNDTVYAGEIPTTTTGNTTVDKPSTDLGKVQPGFSTPDDGATDPPKN